MYLSFFGLKQAPFSIAPDPRFLYMSERHREALAHLLYGVQAGGGFVLLTGEIGAGKTTVCRCFLEQVPAGCQVAYIVNPKLSVAELLQTVAEEFGLTRPGLPQMPAMPAATVKTWVDALNHHLLAAHAQGRHCLLIIDEAQHLSAEVLEQLRLLTNLETQDTKLLQIILIGQPELRGQLAAPGMEQLAQRIIARYHLQALSAAETSAYVAHRLTVAGLAGANPFDAPALRRIHALTGGVPRRINLLCDRALLGAYAHGSRQVQRGMVGQAAQQVFGPKTVTPGSSRRWWGLAAAAGTVVAGTAVLAAGLLLVRNDRMVGGPAGGSPHGAGSAALARPTVALAPSALTKAPLPPTAAAPQPTFDAVADWPALSTDESAALRELALGWGAALPPGSACTQASAQGLGCWRHRAGSLPLLAQLDRPVLLVLVNDAGRTAYARLQVLGPAGVVLAAGTRQWRLTTVQLGALWRGELVTFWRTPGQLDPALASAGAGLSPGASGPAVAALQRALARAGGQAAADDAGGQVYDSSLRQRVAAFQLAAGLKPDGLAGPTTFMQLMRALAVAEPQLARE